MNKTIIMAGMLACTGILAQAQDTKQETPRGKAIVQMFTNFHSGFGSTSQDRGFELERAYLGYEYKLNSELSVKAVTDIGKPAALNDYQRVAYIKNALIKWKTGKLTLNGGLISTTQFNFQEKFWGYRYVLKSFQDLYKMGNSADLGLSLSYDFTDRIQADAIIVNGEGYKKVQVNDGLNYGLGITLKPLDNLSLRLYGALNQSGQDGKQDMTNMAAFAGYKTDRFSIGAEYNYTMNASYNKDAHMYGYSVYTTVNLPKDIALFARADDLSSKDDWNIAKDETAYILGAQFKLGSYVKIAPDLRLNVPKAAGKDNTYAAYVNIYFGL